jgi:hypothetical protein
VLHTFQLVLGKGNRGTHLSKSMKLGEIYNVLKGSAPHQVLFSIIFIYTVLEIHLTGRFEKFEKHQNCVSDILVA